MSVHRLALVGLLFGLLLWAPFGFAETPAPAGAEGEVTSLSFTNVTSQAGLSGLPGFRLSIADVNGDGYPDILLHRQQNDGTGDVLNKQYLYLNVPGDDPGNPFSRKFLDVTAASGIRANRQGTTDGRHSDGAVFADVDNNGDLDLFTMVYVHDDYTLDLGRNDLLLNNGAGHFTLAPNSPFHTEPIYNTAAAVFVDYSNNGNIDLYIGNWYGPGSTLTLDQLYQGLGDGRFTNVTTTSGIGSKTACIYGIADFDWNGDGFADLFAPPYAWTVLNSIPLHWRNNGAGTFTRVEAATDYDDYRGTASTVASFGSMPADYDNNGDIDFLEVLTHGKGDAGTCSMGNIHTTVATNGGPPNYTFSWDCARVRNRATEDTDMTHHGDHYASWFDADNDGLLDFALTECCYTQPSGGYDNRVYLFKQAADHTFSPATTGAGLDEVDNLPGNPPPHNVIPLDYDLDGDEDVLVGFADDVTGIQLFRNNAGTLNNWAVITLMGAGGPTHSNRSAIGARVEVTAGGVTRTREVYAGNGHMGPQAPLSQTFGLGSAAQINRLRVHWPNQAHGVSERTNLPVNHFFAVHEVCTPPADPQGLLVARRGADIVLSWDDPGRRGLMWRVYRDDAPDPRTWGPPHDPNVFDGDAGTPGIQHTDAGAAADGATYFYLTTLVDECGQESPLS